MLVVTLQNLNDDAEAVWEIAGEYEIVGHKYWEQACTALRDGAKATVVCMACEGGDELAHNYYDITLACGMEFSAVSGVHLAGIENWKD